MKPTLLIMAAGMGSRFGGLKQISPVDKNQHIIMDFTIYDAILAGFGKVVCVIRKEHEKDFDSVIGNRLKSKIDFEYAYQELDALPNGYSVPEGRIKPWGIAHAMLCAKDKIKGSFVAINADDFYGRSSFTQIVNFLNNDSDSTSHAMVAYNLSKTLTDKGHVARGVCAIDNDGYLKEVVEHTQIIKTPQGAAFTEDGTNFESIDVNSPVSMNFWGFKHSFFEELEKGFITFLNTEAKQNPLKSEYYITIVVSDMINKSRGKLKVLKSEEKWHGVTYAQDLPDVVAAIENMQEQGIYPYQF